MSAGLMEKHDKRYLSEIRRYVLMQRQAFQRTLSEAARIPNGLGRRACPVCDQPPMSAPGERSNGQPTYVSCPGCGLVFMSPILSDAARDAYMGFDDSDPIMRRYWELRLARAPREVPRPNPDRDPYLKDIVRHKRSGRLLDIGCGPGDFLKKAAYFFEAEGVEINPRLREAARGLGVTVSYERIEVMPEQPMFDVITLNQLLYGLVDPVGVLREARRRLKQGGIVYINTPNADSLAVRVFGRTHSHFSCTNLNVFNLSSLNRLADRAGLRVIEWRTEWLALYPWDVLARWIVPGRFVHRRNAFLPFYSELNACVDWLDRRWIGPRLGRRGDYLIVILADRTGP